MKQTKYYLMLILCLLYCGAMVYCGYKHYISWPLVFASGLPDGVAMYVAIDSLEKTKRLESKLVGMNETLLAYAEKEPEVDVWLS